MFKVAVVEDHEIFRKGIITLLGNIDYVNVIVEASSGEAFLKVLPEQVPDIVFMDIKMLGISGIETTKKAMETRPMLKIIALSMHSEEEYIQQMLEAGAMGFLLKNVNQSNIEKAMKAVMAGNRFFSDELMTLLSNKFLNKNQNSDDSLVKFSDREIEILNLICTGMTNIEIGDKLCLSHRTVDGHRARMIERVGAANTVGLVVYAIKNKLIQV
ncbi:MAG: DNA-binding response regulator [Bacteroidetes bacterium HGW-Bacteroidetes-21]|jgi:DNA-binding NarL/FixJ family response regulator|nr:MAG: DNA-binding response regulator [Bacteroidetes bacterium HGW-Bacteroidetes-21]